ncbi:hypothetical protein [Brevundimonas sp. AJA228-03]|nr:hypothetical protein [Brevundimonas sp. AJA228-03]
MPEKSDPTAERRDEVVKRMLATPPAPRKPKKEGREPKLAPKVKE